MPPRDLIINLPSTWVNVSINMANQKWDIYKSEIEQLYIHENQKLEDVMSYMEIQHSWKKSKAAYTRQLNKWGFKKHSESRNDEWILKRVAKRKRNGKESEVFIDGIQLHPKKIAKAKYGKGFVSTISQYAPSPKTPEGYLVTTPQTTGMCLSWSSSLPWLRFMSFLDPPTEQAPSLPSSSLFVDSSRSGNITKSANFELMQRLSSIVPWNKPEHLENIYSGSRTSAALSILMPETEQGQLDGLSTDLSTLKSGLRDHLSVVLYLISNNLMSPDEDGSYDEQKERDSRLILRLLKDSGWGDPDRLRILLSTHEPTAESIAEKVFESALWIGDLDIVENMLRSGMNPDGLIEAVSEEDICFLTPLQFAALEGNIRLTNLLIKYGADIEHGFANEVDKTALYFAISGANLAVARALFLQGAKVTRECAREAMKICYSYLQKFDLVKEIIDIHLEEHLAAGRNDPDLVVPAVELENEWIVEYFLDRGAKLNGFVAQPYRNRHEGGDICLLGLAVIERSVDIVRLLTYSTVGANRVSSPLYMYPLTLAAMTGETDIAQILLESGADVRAADEGEITLLEHAARKSNLSLCQMLITHGAKVDREPCDAQKLPSALMTAIQKDNMLIVELLINSNARLNDRFEAAPGSVLAAALEVGNDAVIDKLINAGARYVGVKMKKIGNLQTAILMEEGGVLAGVLCSSGHQILAAAISAGHEDLAHFLLKNDAHKEHDARDPFSTSDPITPLEAATKTNNMRLILALLKHGVSVTDYALTYAIQRHSGLLPLLLRSFSGRAPTAVAAALREPSMAALELLREANVDFTGAPRPLLIGSRLNSWSQQWEDDVKSVLEVEVGWIAESSHFTFLLEWAAAAGIPWEPKLVSRALIRTILSNEHDRLAELMQLDFDLSYDMWLNSKCCRFNPLQAAVESQLVWIVREMLMKGADVNYLGDGPRRRTPLQLAVENANMEIFNLLLHHGADVNGPGAEENGATALQIAAIRGFIGIAQRLLDLGADVNAKPAVEDGRTALMGAAEHGRIDVLHLLLDRGALIVGEHRFFFDEAVRLAKNNGHYAAARLLISFEVSLVATGD
ncbi:ankyrin [Aspergillus eucalypticola CBS 122712]|uniref:Ankyrin n=1 Tax=Aspergillus eucalypticola (strain CBS 122712 / IBT 29274) TaxID=1448314 RepID=A0A317V7D9_ASPEC|nr:ankyrin [Aspergillus eucalypticola CBS 122712]PWY69945.1 ankyrin [Aspergillus eucalypticola CBS 122712]